MMCIMRLCDSTDLFDAEDKMEIIRKIRIKLFTRENLIYAHVRAKLSTHARAWSLPLPLDKHNHNRITKLRNVKCNFRSHSSVSPPFERGFLDANLCVCESNAIPCLLDIRSRKLFSFQLGETTIPPSTRSPRTKSEREKRVQTKMASDL